MPSHRPWAHPRSRGENFLIVEVAEKLDGSSPLTRGKLRGATGAHADRGLIPAHAGKTPSVDVAVSFSGAHPRSRGENRVRRCARGWWLGSSPLTRGKPRYTVGPMGVHGLIPAHAGKTRRRGSATRRGRAHPRSRGENHRIKSVAASVTGSSPLTRGKHQDDQAQYLRTGLIPAHAGKTRGRRGCSCCGRAHPRSRGENSSC